VPDGPTIVKPISLPLGHQEERMTAGTFLHTADGRLRVLRLLGWLNLVLAAGDLVVYGWRSLEWIGGLVFALGCFGMSAHEESAQPQGSRWRSPQFVLGMTAALLSLTVGVIW
jgi:hypothetical protein